MKNTGKSKKKIACFGFASDPPHLGHLQIARIILEKNLTNEVWLIPCFKHPCLKKLSSPRHRFKMAKLLEERRIKVSDVEFSRKRKSYTIDTVKILKKKFPDFKFFWVVGSDIVKTKSYKQWKNWAELVSLIKFLVIPRASFKIKKVPAPLILVKARIDKISSSEIRARVKQGLSIEKFVNPKTKEYIKKNNLYKN